MKNSFILLLFLSYWIYLIECGGGRNKIDHKLDQYKKNSSLKSEDIKIQRETNKVQKANSTKDVSKGFELPGFLKLIKSSTVGASSYQIIHEIGNFGEEDKSNELVVQEYECSLRSRVVDVDFSPGYITFPASILVNECSGNTIKNGLQKCVAKEYENVTREYFDLLITDMKSGIENRRKLTTQEPKSCQLVCRVAASDCKPDYVYSSDSCTCSCIENNRCPIKKQWSKISCACECSNEESSCPSNTFWNKDSCECNSV